MVPLRIVIEPRSILRKPLGLIYIIMANISRDEQRKETDTIEISIMELSRCFIKSLQLCIPSTALCGRLTPHKPSPPIPRLCTTSSIEVISNDHRMNLFSALQFPELKHASYGVPRVSTQMNTSSATVLISTHIVRVWTHPNGNIVKHTENANGTRKRKNRCNITVFHGQKPLL